jgi:teichuronic acid biosynthesis glycosyltransferase TuaC
MNILVISHLFPTPTDPTSGIFVLEQLRALRKRGVEATVIVPTPWVPRPLRFLRRAQRYNAIPLRSQIDGFTVEYPRVFALPASFLFSWYGLFWYLTCRNLVRFYAKRGACELIHAHMAMPDGFAAIFFGRETKLPVVCTMHGEDINDYPFRNRLIRWATAWTLRNTARLIAVSSDLRTNAVSLADGLTIDVIRNGADATQFQPLSKEEARLKLGIPLNVRVILFVGYLVVEKSLEDLLSAFAALSCQNVLLYMVGDGYLRTSLEALAASMGLHGKCIFVGYQQHDRVPIWLSAADCLVLSSTTEGSPTILAEAMMCRVPVVATAVGGVPEIVKHGQTGYLAPPRDPISLSKAIATALDADATESIVAAAEAQARTRLTWDANAEETLRVYRDVLAVQRAVTVEPHPQDVVPSHRSPQQGTSI